MLAASRLCTSLFLLPLRVPVGPLRAHLGGHPWAPVWACPCFVIRAPHRAVSRPPPFLPDTRLLEFFADAAECGRLRFVVVSAGAVLESVAELSTPPTTFPIPTKGTYITFKSGGGTHEAHVSVRSVASVALSTEPAKVGGHDLHVMRLLGVGGGPILSLLVAWAEGEGPGSYTPEAVDAFGRLRTKYGSGFTL